MRGFIIFAKNCGKITANFKCLTFNDISVFILCNNLIFCDLYSVI